MSLYNLDFSGWRTGNTAYAQGLMNSETMRAKAQAARMRGMENGIGTIAGAIIGGLVAGPTGAAKGAALGGTMLSGNQLSKDQMSMLAGGLAAESKAAETPAEDVARTTPQKTDYQGAVAPGRMYGAYNPYDPTFYTK